MRAALVILLLFSGGLLFAQSRPAVPGIDWRAQEPDILQHYRALLQIDSSNPPGNETRVVESLRSVLQRAGIETQLFALDPARANLVARIRGNGSKRPLLLMAHTDVVGVQRDKWPVDPFGAVQKDGYVWGRGTVDDKDDLAVNLMVMLLLKRTNAPLDRDVIFLAESGEEARRPNRHRLHGEPALRRDRRGIRHGRGRRRANSSTTASRES